MEDKIDIEQIFASNVFTPDMMEIYAGKSVVLAYRKCVETGASLDMGTAEKIASSMLRWALDRGCTHYTHWFQPLNGGTAEKHQSFIEPDGKGKITLGFSGKELIVGEPDASSFPSGGLRATFEARGYSAWDPSSNAFINDSSLHIPTVFLSYSGESLDEKTPLLRSMKVLDAQALRILRALGDNETQKVTPMAGVEQEYFLLDKSLCDAREDLKICGRTLFGAKPPKTQELDDHYFGSIKPRVAAFMKDLEIELWRLGIPAKTKHNEVAPSQHEMAPVYTDCNIANDQNQLSMDIMKKVADRHGLVCVLAEKPFDGINGSGKHNNWSLKTDRGENLLAPGKTPWQNARFLLFLAAFVSAADEFQDLLRCSAAYAGNDHRLGGDEAPPAVMSIFLGSDLEEVVNSIIEDRTPEGEPTAPIRIGISAIPSIPRDTSDRNRTSPLAFTGNKFEFRMPGASQSVAEPNMILNTIVADRLSSYADRLESADPDKLNDTLHDLIKSEFKEHRRILFNGNGYCSAWVVEAQERGLSNLADTTDALPTYLCEKNIALMERTGVLTRGEMTARDEIRREKYLNVTKIEAKTLLGMVLREIVPAIALFKHSIPPSSPGGVEARICRDLDKVSVNLYSLAQSLGTAVENIPGATDPTALGYCKREILPLMEEMRLHLNKAENLVPSKFWPYPAYGQLLFSV